MNIFQIKPLYSHLFLMLFFMMFILIQACFVFEWMRQKKIKNPQEQLMELASGHIISRAIHVAASMKLADYIAKKPCSVDELAHEVDANSAALYRLLRLLVSHDIFYENEHKFFSMTPLAQLLVSMHSESLRAWLAYHDGDEMRWRSYGNMEYTIHTGKPAFNYLFGDGFFDLLAKNSLKAAAFDEGMRNISEKEDLQIVASYDLSPYKTIVDIGGGKGGLLKAIMQSNLSAHGILFDLPHAKVSAESYLSEHNLSSRISCESGNFFDKISTGSDLYILKRILHDWDDESCIKILSHCRQAMKQNAKLLIIEAIVETGNKRNFIKEIDVAMLLLFGGKERTQDEWNALLDAAHLKLVSVYTTPSMLSILEVVAE